MGKLSYVEIAEIVVRRIKEAREEKIQQGYKPDQYLEWFKRDAVIFDVTSGTFCHHGGLPDGHGERMIRDGILRYDRPVYIGRGSYRKLHEIRYVLTNP